MISPMRARVLAQKSEEATASSASLLATPLTPTGSFHFRGVPLYISTSIGQLKLTHVDSEVNQSSCEHNHL